MNKNLLLRTDPRVIYYSQLFIAAIDAADIARSERIGVITVTNLKASKGSGFLLTTIVLPGRRFEEAFLPLLKKVDRLIFP